MKRINRRSILAALLVMLLAASALLAGCGKSLTSSRNALPAGTQYFPADEDPASTGISVSAQGTVTVKPDVATVQLGVETMDADAGKARKANDEAMAKVLAALKGFGISEDDVTTTNYGIYPRYDDKGEKITGFTVTNNVSVKVRDLNKLGDVLTAASEAGANTAGGISFDVEDRTKAYNEALALAMEKAKARAEIMAKACGVTLGRAMVVNESSSYSGPTYAAADMAMASKAASVPVSGGTLDVTASVSVVYEIVK
jgi:uncharacterized protein YggE